MGFELCFLSYTVTLSSFVGFHMKIRTHTHTYKNSLVTIVDFMLESANSDVHRSQKTFLRSFVEIFHQHLNLNLHLDTSSQSVASFTMMNRYLHRC